MVPLTFLFHFSSIDYEPDLSRNLSESVILSIQFNFILKAYPNMLILS